ncbi:restriction endonuclease subunit S [Aeromonas veronii]|uniref:restriction endonuclease subunit S n=1 Tax=Aeromonas veronii TaxID=654 RepID=UPI001D0AF5A9|nr:restriction endonuclease subunit S [Aeromonas veronii]MCC0088555.1 restriction endonuclease subunit S [Aeromonas veronii]
MKAEWKMMPLGEVSVINYGYTESATSDPIGPKFLRITDIQDSGVNWDDVPFCQIDATGLKKFMLAHGDIVFARTGATTGKSFLVIDPPEAVFASYLIRLRLQDMSLLPEFVSLYFQSKEYWDAIRTGSSGSAQGGFNASKLAALMIPVPPLPKQQRIVAILDEAFEAIATARANAEQNRQNARALFDSYLQSVFSQRDKGWLETTIDKISTNLDSKRIPITKSDRKAGKYPYYGASGIVDYVADYIFDGDSLLVSEDGANLLARSTPIAFSVSGKYWVNNHAHILKFEHMATQRFVEFYFASILLDEYITGAAQPKLNQKALNSIPIPIPVSIELQAEIVGRIESLHSETQRLESLYQRKIAALDELKQSLLQQAFSGQL